MFRVFDVSSTKHNGKTFTAQCSRSLPVGLMNIKLLFIEIYSQQCNCSRCKFKFNELLHKFVQLAKISNFKEDLSVIMLHTLIIVYFQSICNIYCY